MFNLSDLFILLLIAHILGDYQLQSQKLSDAKASGNPKLSRRAFLFHLVVHFIILLPILFFIVGAFRMSFIFLAMFLVAVHGLLDLGKNMLLRGYGRRDPRMNAILYIADQVIHIAAILIISNIYISLFPNAYKNPIDRTLLNWILLVVLNAKPANVTFKILFQRFQLPDAPNKELVTDRRKTPVDENFVDKTVPGAGALIGNMERILSAIFLHTNNIAAIGFVYTAKSIARFKHIEESKAFAEYYLIGTLYSILFVVASYYVIFQVLV